MADDDVTPLTAGVESTQPLRGMSETVVIPASASSVIMNVSLKSVSDAMAAPSNLIQGFATPANVP